MIKNSCHPSIEKWLIWAGILRPEHACFFSSFLPGSGQAHSGLLQAVKYRLTDNENKHIILFSFYSKEALRKEDKYGILSLEGTNLVRLPATKKELDSVFDKCKTPLSIQDDEWKRFSIPAYTAFIKELIGRLKHGNPNALGTTALNPLRLSCVCYLQQPDKGLDKFVRKELSNLQHYLQQGAAAEFISMTIHATAGNGTFLQQAKNFASDITKLAGVEFQNAADAKSIIFIVDGLNQKWDTLTKDD